jgi:hypothetical protein
MEEISLRKVSEDLEFLKKAVIAIQEYIEDIHLTDDEEELLDEYLKDKREGKLISHEDLKAELGL